jgi:hypothetical protein
MAPEQQKRVELKRIFSDSNIARLKGSLASETWDTVLSSQGVNNQWETFLNILMCYLDLHCPATKVCKNTTIKDSHKGKVALDAHALSLRSDMHSMYDLFVNTGIELYKDRYKMYKSLFRREVRLAKSEYIKYKITSSDNISKSSWAFINSIRGHESENRPKENISLMINDQLIDDPTTISNKFNDYFVDLVRDDPNTCRTNISKDIDLSELDEGTPLTITTERVIEVIDTLKNKSSSGWDNISPSLLKKCKLELAHVLSFLIQSVFESGIFPELLKFTIVKPIHKKGPKTLIQNFRPISITSVFSK